MDVSIEENLDTTDKRELGDFLVALLYLVNMMKLMLINMHLLIFVSFRSRCNFFNKYRQTW